MTDDELRAELKRADPATSLAPIAPETASRLLDRAIARSSIPRTTRPAPRVRLGVLAAAGIVALLVVGATIFQVRAKAGHAPGTGAAKIVAGDQPSSSRSPSVTRISLAAVTGESECPQPDAGQLAEDAHVALEGTVRSIDDGVISLRVDHVWAGSTTDLVEVDADGDTTPVLAGVALKPGETYLIAATSDGDVMACGYSGPDDPQLRALYEAAF